jgi:hypothetical protein
MFEGLKRCREPEECLACPSEFSDGCCVSQSGHFVSIGTCNVAFCPIYVDLEVIEHRRGTHAHEEHMHMSTQDFQYIYYLGFISLVLEEGKTFLLSHLQQR